MLAEVDAAWERAQDLLAGELELHFAVSADGRVRGELRLPGGETVERVTATEALALACGDAELRARRIAAYGDGQDMPVCHRYPRS